MAQFLVDQLTSLGAFNVEKRPVGTHKLEGKEVDLPPVVIGQVGNDPNPVPISLYPRPSMDWRPQQSVAWCRPAIDVSLWLWR